MFVRIFDSSCISVHIKHGKCMHTQFVSNLVYGHVEIRQLYNAIWIGVEGNAIVDNLPRYV